MSYQSVEAQSFWDCVNALRSDDKYKGHLIDTLSELRQKPFKNPQLRTHSIGKARNGKDLFASDVGGRQSDRRVVWQVVNRTVVVLLYGTHKIYDRAKRMRIDFDDGLQQVMLYEQSPDSGQERAYVSQRAVVGKLFMAWSDDELASHGFPPATVAHLRRLDADDELLALQSEFGPYFETAFNLVADGASRRLSLEPGAPAGGLPDDELPGDGSAENDVPWGDALGGESPDDEAPAAGDELEPPVKAPEVAEDDIVLEARLLDDRAGAWFTRTEPEFMAGVIGRPIEDWMIFLHPDQRSAARRSYNGPARVRGAAGTGKTVVGLHRAAWLAERNREADEARRAEFFFGTSSDSDPQTSLPVLFTTYIKTLPPVFESLFLRLPGADAAQIRFVNIDKLAREICHDMGDRAATNPREIKAAFDTAYADVVLSGEYLPADRFSKRYLQEEITKVIKGRALETLDEYLGVERTGRRVPMRHLQRTQVWELMQAWDAEMARRNTVDFADVIVRAIGHASRLETALYSSVIVDEAQDLTLAGLRLLRMLVNAPDHDVDRPDGLLILGDAAQRIYPGGFTLRQAGVEVRGRTTVLTSNYRNTEEIIGTALAVAGESHIEDLGEQFRRGDEVVSALRRGPRPLLIKATGLDAQLDEIVGRIGEVTAAVEGYSLGDIAVLVATTRQVDAVRKRLDGHDLANQKLDTYDGTPDARVKVGTYHRAKGLEFKAVFLPQVSRDVFPRGRGRNQSEEEHAEARDLEISQLFVAMTRARDLLVVLYDHNPSDVIAAAAKRFEPSEP